MAKQLEASEQHRREVLKALMCLVIFAGLLFGVINIFRELYVLSALEFAYAAFSLHLLRFIGTTERLRFWTVIFLLPLFSLMIFAVLLPRTSFTVFAWVQTIPIICYLLLGLRTGLFMSAAFVGLGVLGFNYRYMTEASLFNIVIVANVGLSSMAMMLFSHVYERSRVDNEQRLLDLASTDGLTGLANRMKLADVFERERSHALRDNRPLSLVVLDLDHFKRINDQFGHDGGDQVLRHVAALLPTRLRETDLFCRLGGEEFALLLPGADLSRAAELADSLREHLCATPLQLEGGLVNLSFSAGVASLGEDGCSLDQLLQTADRRMYEAKGGGRNQVVAAGQHYSLSR
ncbi:diguanylate cyclase (GGDEF) domain-containing protein [Halopseudomonas xinjiangensis]|uniref:diguanylate cyclase n=1 Tax=Halopseudomonas xinjiangensis TaxID=487184 RepID=A0A1H1L575_9GAMM|nr:GGDEF domain-containing protein [Halopseudomonas xinjiangensis]SDR69734.1 diguanylate cyclase (GGDEF) domain-containing protein [Halopseudomonas xinjiangensis]